jgi:hypothetical protein
MLAKALRAWASFPAGAAPRPLILLGPVIDDPHSGFKSGDDKLAFASGNFVLATELPPGRPTSDGRPLIDAEDAFALLTGQHAVPKPSTALKVTDVQLATGSFRTDRGPQQLPAWVFTLAGVRAPAGVLAIPAEDRWPGQPDSGVAENELTAHLSADGRTATVTFVGAEAGSGPCAAEYDAEVAESSTAVAMAIHTRPRPTTGNGDEVCDLVGHQRTVTVTLDHPLGGRVLIDQAAGATAVTTAAQ